MTRSTLSGFLAATPSSGITRRKDVPGPISAQVDRASGRRKSDLGVIKIKGLRKGSAIWRLWMWKQLAKFKNWIYSLTLFQSNWVIIIILTRGRRVSHDPVSIVELFDSKIFFFPIWGEKIGIVILHLQKSLNTAGGVLWPHTYKINILKKLALHLTWT